MISSRSRYAAGVTAWVDHPRQGRVQVVHLQPARWINYPFVEYVARSSDTFDIIAHRMYEDATSYWFVAEMNPKIMHPDDLSVGTSVFIPAEKTR